MKQSNAVHTFLALHDTLESTMVLHIDPSSHMYQYDASSGCFMYWCISNTITYDRKVLSEHNVRAADLTPVHFGL
jgi:hypothetical protein